LRVVHVDRTRHRVLDRPGEFQDIRRYSESARDCRLAFIDLRFMLTCDNPALNIDFASVS
jgi:hypothetical protein